MPPAKAARLTPWPTDPDELTAAREALLDALYHGDPGTKPAGLNPDGTHRVVADIWRTSFGQAKMDHYAGAASAMIEREAPGAPQSVKNESMVRLFWYLYFSDGQGALFSITSAKLGPKENTYEIPKPGGALRLSGAKGLLSPWKVRRGGLA